MSLHYCEGYKLKLIWNSGSTYDDNDLEKKKSNSWILALKNIREYNEQKIFRIELWIIHGKVIMFQQLISNIINEKNKINQWKIMVVKIINKHS